MMIIRNVSVALAIGLISCGAVAEPYALSDFDMDRVTAGNSLQEIQKAYQTASQEAIRAGDDEALQQARQEYEAALAALSGSDDGGSGTTDVTDDGSTNPEDFDETDSAATTAGEVTTSVTDTADGSIATAGATAETDGGLATVFTAADADPGRAQSRSEAFSTTTTLTPTLLP
jgi:hypothetical protein